MLAAVLVAGLPVQAEEPAVHLSSEAMKALMHTYYDGERSQIIPFGGVAIGNLTTGALLLTGDSALTHAAAGPVIAFGAVELLAGLFFTIRAGPHLAHLDQLLVDNPQEFVRTERVRTHRIRDLFQPALLIAEGVIAVGGGVMAGIGAKRNLPTVEGIGLGLLVEAVVLFVLDWAVLDRARAYATALDAFEP